MKVEMWYIKDAGHRYVDANINFCHIFCMMA